MSTPAYVETTIAVTVQTKRGDRVSVKLKKNFGMNVIGDVCGFKPELADKLVKAGDASYVKMSDAEKARREKAKK